LVQEEKYQEKPVKREEIITIITIIIIIKSSPNIIAKVLTLTVRVRRSCDAEKTGIKL
jgi:hypothetical protein